MVWKQFKMIFSVNKNISFRIDKGIFEIFGAILYQK